jgi:hypothetical protein
VQSSTDVHLASSEQNDLRWQSAFRNHPLMPNPFRYFKTSPERLEFDGDVERVIVDVSGKH